MSPSPPSGQRWTDAAVATYDAVMRDVWNHPANEQRPAIRRWLMSNAARGEEIIDIGAGDAYYIDDLQPKAYVAVEPNSLLQERTRQAAAQTGVTCVLFSSVTELLGTRAIDHCGLVLMIHVLLYLAPGEATALLTRIRATGITLLMVHPDPDRSVSVAFEREHGFDRSAKLLQIKLDTLGPPRKQTRVESHFVLPADFAPPDLAFLVSHHVLDGTLNLNPAIRRR